MHRHRTASWVVVLAVVLALVPEGHAIPVEAQIPGVWQGELAGDKPGERLRVVLKVAREKGTLVGRFYSPDQGNKEYIAQTVRLTDRRVEFYLVFLGASFDGTMSDDGSEMRGIWKQNGVSKSLVFRRVPAN